MLKKKDPPMLCVVFLTGFGLKVLKRNGPFIFNFFFISKVENWKYRNWYYVGFMSYLAEDTGVLIVGSTTDISGLSVLSFLDLTIGVDSVTS